MKVLFIANYFPPLAGGSAVVYDNICRHFDGEIRILAPWRHYGDGLEIKGWQGSDADKQFSVERIELLRPLLNSTRYLSEFSIFKSVLKKIHLIIREFSPDVVCFGEVHSQNWLGLYVRKILKIPVIFYTHGEEITGGSGSRLLNFISKKALYAADAVITVSNFTRNELISRNVDPTKIHLISNGVDIDFFSQGEPDFELIDKYALNGKRVLLTIARIEERKGHDQVIKAMPEILKKFPETTYLIVGKGGYLSYLKKLVQDLGLEEYVKFTGLVPLDDLVKLYRCSEIFVMPNRTLPNGDTEGFGLVFLEANACGLPVIGGRDGGVPDAVDDGISGLLVDGTDLASVTDGIIKLMSDRGLSQRLASQGYERAQSFGWPSKSREFKEICQTVIGNSHVRPR